MNICMNQRLFVIFPYTQFHFWHDDILTWQAFHMTSLLWGNPLVTCGFPAHRTIMWIFQVFVVISLNKLLNKNNAVASDLKYHGSYDLAYNPSNIASTSIHGTESVAVNITVIYNPGKLESHTNTLALFICPQPEPGYRNGEQRFWSFSTRETYPIENNRLPIKISH